jgi:hypothetical protein
MNFLFNRKAAAILNMTYEGGSQHFISSAKKVNFSSEITHNRDLARKQIRMELQKIFELHAARELNTCH